MNNEEHHAYLCSILEKLIDSELTAGELADLASALGIRVDEFYTAGPVEVFEVIEWRKVA